MTLLRALPLLVLTLMALLAPPVAAVPVTSGYATQSFVRDCAETSCNDLSQPPSGGVGTYSTGGNAAFTADQWNATVLQSTGSAGAQASPGAGLGAPVLKAEVASLAPEMGSAFPNGTLLSAQAIGVQRFRNTTDSELAIQYNLAIDWTSSGILQDGGAPGLRHGLYFDALVFDTTSGTLDVDLGTSQLSQALNLGLLFAPDPTMFNPDLAIAHMLSGYFPENGPGLFTESLELTLAAGEEFFVGSRLLAVGGEGAAVDAFSTMETFFTDGNGVRLGADSGLAAVTTAVPAPAPLALIVLGFLALRLRRTACA